MVTPAQPATPAIDYTDKDFRSLREAMLRLAAQRLPEWTDRSPADLGMLLVDLFAYCGDVMLYYQDRIAGELFPSTASERAGIVDMLRLIGYELSPATAAVADLQLTFAMPAAAQTVTVPHGATFSTGAGADTGGAIEFTYLGPKLELDLRSDQVRPGIGDDNEPVVRYDGLPVEQSRQENPPPLGNSTGEAGQSFPLPHQAVVVDSVVVQVDEGAGWVTWDRRESLLFDIAADGRAVFAHPGDRTYQLLFDATGTAHVVFGSGRRPPVGTDKVRASYRVCQGAAGNVAAGAITEAQTPITGLRSVINPAAAVGGGDAERPDHAIRYAPFAFRSTNRAVTTSDYVALAHRTGTVAKVRARSTSWNTVDLYVAPAGPVLRPVPEALRHRLLGYFEDKRMAGTTVAILDAEPVAVDISVELTVDKRFLAEVTVSQVARAVAALLDFEAVDFGHTLYQSDIYAAAESVEGVLGATVTRFQRADRPAPDLEAELARYQLPPMAQLPPFLRNAVATGVAPEGRIDIGEFEIPTAGVLDVRLKPAG